jgi:hypothetical protein
LTGTLGDDRARLLALFEGALEAHLSALVDWPATLVESCRYALGTGGKRVRPLLCLMAAEAAGGDARAALPIALGLELVHTYSLVHDDLPSMDDDDMRRGRPTVHKAWGEPLALLAGEGRIGLRTFDPQGDSGPSPVNQLHLNSVTASDRGLFLAGLRTPGLLCLSGNSIALVATLPEGTHNAQPFRNGILFHDTQADVVRHVTPSRQRTFDVPRHDPALLTHTELDDSGIARQAFGRGLCVLSDSLVAAGSSPATVTLHDIDENRTTRLVNLSLDIRTSIHGLARWPFD